MQVYNRPSRFLREIPAELFAELRPPEPAPAPAYQKAGYGRTGIWGSRGQAGTTVGGTVLRDRLGLALGQRVTHNTFGEGVVLQLEGDGQHTRVQVHFAQSGAKWLMAAMADLTVL
jgi:DNA helicase-2/ATP-dependent DNA helicase PcrA